jgi:uncharacterized membrane protein
MFCILPLLLLCLVCMVPMTLMMFRGLGARWLPFWGSGTSAGHSEPPTPRQILDRGYASGEITDERYQAMRNDLEAGPPADRTH